MFALCASGYVLAWAAGAAAVWLKNLGISHAEQTASSGMYAFADAVTFIAVACALSIVPTFVLLRLVGPLPRFWNFASRVSVALASSALVFDLLWALPFDHVPISLRPLCMLAPLRFFSSPLLVLLFLPGAFVCRGPSRRRMILALAVEVVAAGFVILWFGFQLMSTRS